MSVPINAIDVQRFRAITELFLAENIGELKLYTSTDRKTGETYTSIELTGSLPTDKIKAIFNK
jgi:hypothetical protein